MAYTTDLTIKEFKIIEPLLPRPYIQTRPPKWSKHEILNGISYQLINDCRWAGLPKDLPPSGTVFYWLNKWKKDGAREEISKQVFIQFHFRKRKKRNFSTPYWRFSGS